MIIVIISGLLKIMSQPTKLFITNLNTTRWLGILSSETVEPIAFLYLVVLPHLSAWPPPQKRCGRCQPRGSFTLEKASPERRPLAPGGPKSTQVILTLLADASSAFHCLRTRLGPLMTVDTSGCAWPIVEGTDGLMRGQCPPGSPWTITLWTRKSN